MPFAFRIAASSAAVSSARNVPGSSCGIVTLIFSDSRSSDFPAHFRTKRWPVSVGASSPPAIPSPWQAAHLWP